MGYATSFPKMLGPVAMSMEKVEHQKNTHVTHTHTHTQKKKGNMMPGTKDQYITWINTCKGVDSCFQLSYGTEFIMKDLQS